MKKLLLIGIATVSVALGAFGQGSINVDNSSLAVVGISSGSQGNFFSGNFALQVWVLNSLTPAANINTLAGLDSYTAYQNMLAAGYTLQGSFFNRTITALNAGVFSLGELQMAGVNRALDAVNGTTAMALVAWQGSGNTFPGDGGLAGVVTFANQTSDYTILPPNTPTPKNLTGWDATGKDLILSTVVSIPEPGTFALAGFGVAALLAFRRRS